MSAYHFFLKHAGYSYKQNEKPIVGRRRCAKQLARAEERAKRKGIFFQWQLDGQTSAEWIDADDDGGENNNPWPTWECLAIDPKTDECIAALCGIDFGRDGEPWNDPYKRVVEAELASESRL